MSGSGGTALAPRRWTAYAVLALGALGVVAALAACRPIAPGDCTATWTGATAGDWTDAARWSAGVVPIPTDVACAPTGSTIRITSDVVVGSVAIDGTVELDGGSLAPTRGDLVARIGHLDLAAGRFGGTTMAHVTTLTWSGGAIGGASILSADAATITGGVRLDGGRRLDLVGTSTATGAVALCDTATLNPVGSLTITDATISTVGCTASSATLTAPASATTTLAGTTSIGVPVANAGTVVVATDAEVDVASFSQSAGSTTVGDDAVLASDATLSIAGGRLEGAGTVAADVSSAGTVAPGPGIETLIIDGTYTGTMGARVELQVTGSSVGTHDQLGVTTIADVSATALVVTVATPDAPGLGAEFDVVQAGALSGPPASATLPAPDAYLLVEATSLVVRYAPCDPNTFHPGADLQDAQLAGADLGGCDLTGADLRWADLTGAILDGATLDGATLTGADLEGASAVDATFVGTAFEDADITGADFTDADLTNAYIEDHLAIFPNPYGDDQAIWSGTTCPNGRTSDTLPNGCEGTWTGPDCPTHAIAPDAQLQNCDLSGTDLTGADLTWADLTGAILDGATLDGATLTGADLEGASAVDATFVGTAFEDADITGADFTDADLTNAYIEDHLAIFPNPYGDDQAIWSGTTCPNGRTSDTLPNGCEGTWTGPDCPTHAIAPDAQLQNCDLSGTDLTGADLTWADLTGAILDGATLDGATLTGADLEGASAVDATFVGTAFEDADITGADFTDADLTNAYIEDHLAIFPNPYGDDQAIWSGTTCPNGRTSDTLPNGCEGTWTGPDCPVVHDIYPDLADAQLQNCDLAWFDFADADVSWADLTGATLDGADFNGGSLEGANLEGASAVGTGFIGTNLEDAQISDVDLTDADLTDAYVEDLLSTFPNPYGQDAATWANTTCPNGRNSDTLPDGCEGTWVGSDCVNENFVPFADLRNCDLNQHSPASGSETDLTGANLTGANLDDVGADEWNLTGADLTGASAVGAGFFFTNLTGADITGVDFTGADLTGAWATSGPIGQDQAIWTGAWCPNEQEADLLPNGCAGTFLTGPPAPGAVLSRDEADDTLGAG